jgi:hypothetical protein
MVPTVQVLRLDFCVRLESFQYIMLPCVSCHPDDLATYALFLQLGKERAECHSLALLFSGVDFAVGGHVLCAWGRVGYVALSVIMYRLSSVGAISEYASRAIAKRGKVSRI